MNASKRAFLRHHIHLTSPRLPHSPPPPRCYITHIHHSAHNPPHISSKWSFIPLDKARKPHTTAARKIATTKKTKNVAANKTAAAPTPRAQLRTAAKKFAPLVKMAAMKFSSYEGSYQQDPKAVEARVFDVLKGFAKVNKDNLKTTANFHKDLGLDSLDRVEVMLAIEEEFNVEFSDEQSDKFASVFEVVDYLSKKPDIHVKTFNTQDV